MQCKSQCSTWAKCAQLNNGTPSFKIHHITETHLCYRFVCIKKKNCGKKHLHYCSDDNIKNGTCQVIFIYVMF